MSATQKHTGGGRELKEREVLTTWDIQQAGAGLASTGLEGTCGFLGTWPGWKRGFISGHLICTLNSDCTMLLGGFSQAESQTNVYLQMGS